MERKSEQFIVHKCPICGKDSPRAMYCSLKCAIEEADALAARVAELEAMLRDACAKRDHYYCESERLKAEIKELDKDIYRAAADSYARGQQSERGLDPREM